MKTRREILAELRRLKSDERLTYKPALVAVNAPLALIQTEGESRIRALQWALELKPSKFPLRKRKKSP